MFIIKTHILYSSGADGRRDKEKVVHEHNGRFSAKGRVRSCCLQEKMHLDVAISSNLGQSQKDTKHCFSHF